MSNFYCIWVRTGFENKIIEKTQAFFDSVPEGHIFWETENIFRAKYIKEQESFITDVNRSNKRINFEVTLMNGKRILSLSYQEIQKAGE